MVFHQPLWKIRSSNWEFSSSPSFRGEHKNIFSKIPPTYPWKIPRMFHQQFMKEFLSLWGFGEVWGIFPGYVGKIIDIWVAKKPVMDFFSVNFGLLTLINLEPPELESPRMAMEIWCKIDMNVLGLSSCPNVTVVKGIYIYIYLEHLRGAKWMERGAH